MNRRGPNFLHLLFFSLYSNRVRLMGSAVVVLIPLGYLILLFFSSPGSFTNFFYSPAESVAMPLFIAAFSLMASQALSDKSLRLSVLGPYTRTRILFALIVSTLIVAAVATFLTIIVLSIANYTLTILASEATVKASTPNVPQLSDVLGFWLQRYLGLMGLFSSVTLMSFALLVWGARRFGEALNMLVTLSVSFLGTIFQFEVMLDSTARYYTFTYYMYALGSIISGLRSNALGPTYLDLPGYLPVTVLGILFSFLFLLWLAWLGFQRLDVGAD